MPRAILYLNRTPDHGWNQWKSFQYWYHADHVENWILHCESAVEQRIWVKIVGYLNFAGCKQIRDFRNYVISQLLIHFAKISALPQDPARRGGASLACVIFYNGQHPMVPLSQAPKTDTNAHWKKVQNYITVHKFEGIAQFHIDFPNILHFSTLITICMFVAILQFHINFSIIPHVLNDSTFSQ